jgi:hypothetical protein
VLGIITLVALGLAWLAENTRTCAGLSPYLGTVSYSATFLFHMIPAIAETTTRWPLGAPLLPNADASALPLASGLSFVLFLVGATLQIRALRAGRADVLQRSAA